MASTKNSKQGADRMATADPTNQSAFITRSKKEEDKQQVQMIQRLRNDLLRMRQEELFPDMQFKNGSHIFPGHKLIIKSRTRNVFHEDWFHTAPGELPTLHLNHKTPEESKQFLDILYTSEEVDVDFIIQGIKTEGQTPPKKSAADADVTVNQGPISENISKDTPSSPVKQQEHESHTSDPADKSADVSPIPQFPNSEKEDKLVSQAAANIMYEDLPTDSSSECSHQDNTASPEQDAALKVDEEEDGLKGEEPAKHEEKDSHKDEESAKREEKDSHKDEESAKHEEKDSHKDESAKREEKDSHKGKESTKHEQKDSHKDESAKHEEATDQVETDSSNAGLADLNEGGTKNGTSSHPEPCGSVSTEEINNGSKSSSPSDGDTEEDGGGNSASLAEEGGEDHGGSVPANGSLAAPYSDSEVGSPAGNGEAAGTTFRSCGRLASDLLQSYQSGDLTDCCLKVNGHKFMAHSGALQNVKLRTSSVSGITGAITFAVRCILAARCEYFSAMFAGTWSESEETEIELYDVASKSVKYILLFLYGAMPKVPVADITAVIQASDMYGVEGLKEWLCFHITRDYCHFFHKPCQKCTTMVPDILVLASQFNLTDLLERANRWMATHFRRIWEMPAFSSLPPPLLEECIKAVVDQLSVQNTAQIILDVHDLARTLQRNHRAEQVQVAAVKVLYKALTFCAEHFPALVTSPSFLSWSRGGAWCLDLLMENYTMVVSILQPDTACEVYSSLRQQLAISEAETGDEGSFCRSEEARELLTRLVKRCEWYFHRYIHGVIQCPQWSKLPEDLRQELLQKSSFVPVSAATTVGAQSRAAQKSAKALQDNIEHTVNMLCETDPTLFPSLSLVRKILPTSPHQQKPKRIEASSRAAATASSQGAAAKGSSKSLTTSGSAAKGKSTPVVKSTANQAAAARTGPAGSPRMPGKTSSQSSQRPSSGRAISSGTSGVAFKHPAKGSVMQGNRVSAADPATAAEARSLKSSSTLQTKGASASARPDSAKNRSTLQGKSTSASARPDSASNASTMQGKSTSASARPDSAKNSSSLQDRSTSASARPESAKKSSTPQVKSTSASARRPESAKKSSTSLVKSTSASARPDSKMSTMTPQVRRSLTSSLQSPSRSGPGEASKTKTASSLSFKQPTMAAPKALKESSMGTGKGTAQPTAGKGISALTGKGKEASAEPSGVRPGLATAKGARAGPQPLQSPSSGKNARQAAAAPPPPKPSAAKSSTATAHEHSSSRHKPFPSSPKVPAAREPPASGAASSKHLVNKSTQPPKKINSTGQSTAATNSSKNGEQIEHATQTRISYVEKHEVGPAPDQDTQPVGKEEKMVSGTADGPEESSETTRKESGKEASCESNSNQPCSVQPATQEMNTEENSSSAQHSPSENEEEKVTNSPGTTAIVVVDDKLAETADGRQHGACKPETATVEPHAPASVTEPPPASQDISIARKNSQDGESVDMLNSTEETDIMQTSIKSESNDNTSTCLETAVSCDLDIEAAVHKVEKEDIFSGGTCESSAQPTTISGTEDVLRESASQEMSEDMSEATSDTPVPTITIETASDVEDDEEKASSHNSKTDDEGDESSIVVITPETDDDCNIAAVPEKCILTDEANTGQSGESGQQSVSGQELSQQLNAAEDRGDGNRLMDGQGECKDSGNDEEAAESSRSASVGDSGDCAKNELIESVRNN